ncbi:MAG TPA: ferredoxin reductase family protein, partial [Solirubrobacteraceae bacterium]|nr:ferredoxin reductase family protein [Solirubrobacteraceae bacterium]
SVPYRRSRWALGGWALGVLGLANAAAITVLWWQGGGVDDIDDTASLLTSLGRLTGLLGAYLVLVQVLLLGRIPVLDRLVGFDRLTVWHRRNGHACLTLLLAHAGLVTAGYALDDGVSLPTEAGRLVTGYPGVITATAGLAMLIAVVVTSIVIVRRRLRYETWYFVHLYAYLAIALAFSHQLATGTDFVGGSLARAYWYALYLATLGALVLFRLGIPAARNAYYGLRVDRVVAEGPGVVSLEIGGAHLDRLKARAGQFFTWRFLTRDHWWEAHPFSLSAAPDGRRLRITVKGLGAYSAGLGSIRPGTRVVVEGPFGAFTSAARRRPRVALIAGGVGIAPIRALLEDMPGEAGDIAVVYRAAHADDVILRGELDDLARRRGADLHYVLGDHRDPQASALLSPEHLRELVPDIAARDVYVCGPPAMTVATGASLRRAGVPSRQIITERFAL